jgi:SulP family sulfate permease
MSVNWSEETKLLAGELRRRFSTVAIDPAAPLRLRESLRAPTWRADALGGLAVAVMAVPQVMAYALVAGVPPVMGLYSLVVVGLLAGLWAHSAHLACGPSNASSLMLGAVLLASMVPGDLPTKVALIALVMGLFQAVSGLLGAGALTKYISRTVVVGYTTAIGVLIFLNQIAYLIGTDIEVQRGLFAKVFAGLATIPRADVYSVLTGAVTLLGIVVSRRLLPWMPSGFSGIAAGGLFAWGLRALAPGTEVRLVEDLQHIPVGLPALVWPRFTLQSVYDLVGPAIALGLLASIEVATISKNMAMRTGQPTRPNQDILALGIGNMIGAFFGAMPGSGSFTRSEFSYRSGVSTRLGIVFCALFGLVILLASARLLEKIPIPALAALIMWLSVKLIDPKHIRVALLSTFSDGIVFLITFFAAIFLRLDAAIYLGVLVSMSLFLQKASRPRLMEFEFDNRGRFRQTRADADSAVPQISIVHVEGELFFGAAEFIQEEIWRTIDRDRTRVVVLRLRNAQNLDASGVMVLEQLVTDLKRMGIHVLVSGTSRDIDRVMSRSGLDQFIGRENYFPSMDNFLDATRRAVIRANELVGVKNPAIRLFYDRDMEENRAAAPPATLAVAATTTSGDNPLTPPASPAAGPGQDRAD